LFREDGHCGGKRPAYWVPFITDWEHKADPLTGGTSLEASGLNRGVQIKHRGTANFEPALTRLDRLAFPSSPSFWLSHALNLPGECERFKPSRTEATMTCQDPVRRSLLLTALAAGANLAAKSVAAEEDQPGSDERPQKGDFLVHSEGEHAGEIIKPNDLTLGGPPMHAWPKDPKSSVIRKGSRLNEIVLVKLDPGELDEESRSRSTALSPIR
jgi:hypothetical protein